MFRSVPLHRLLFLLLLLPVLCRIILREKNVHHSLLGPWGKHFLWLFGSSLSFFSFFCFFSSFSQAQV